MIQSIFQLISKGMLLQHGNFIRTPLIHVFFACPVDHDISIQSAVKALKAPSHVGPHAFSGMAVAEGIEFGQKQRPVYQIRIALIIVLLWLNSNKNTLLIIFIKIRMQPFIQNIFL